MMKQYRSLDSTMETRDHFKNVANPKSLMSRGNLIKALLMIIAVL